MILKFNLFEQINDLDPYGEEIWEEEVFKIGDKVVKNHESWIVTEFDGWGRGIGTGVIVSPPFELDENEVDVRWPAGRCFETTDQLKKVK